MNKIIILTCTILILQIFSCDKVRNPILHEYVDIDTTLLYGMSLAEYKANEWPTFVENPNTDVNVLIEDFTGHICVACPNAALEAHTIQSTNPGRIFIASIHAGSNGNTELQATSPGLYSMNFTNPDGLQIAANLTTIDFAFDTNPAGTTNRKRFNSHMFNPYTMWSEQVSTILINNSLKVNLQAATHYFPETKGCILHTEVELLDENVSELYQVVYLIEDSLIACQKTMSSWNPPYQDINYVHRDIHRGCIDGNASGRKLTAEMKVDKNGNPISGNKYYLNYSYKIPNQLSGQHNKDNMHFLIYVYDNNTKEILQVIKQEIID